MNNQILSPINQESINSARDKRRAGTIPKIGWPSKENPGPYHCSTSSLYFVQSWSAE